MRVDRYDTTPRHFVKPFFFYANAFSMQSNTQFMSCLIHKVAHAMLFASGNDKILWLILLQHEPLHLDVIFSMTPVSLGIQIA